MKTDWILSALDMLGSSLASLNPTSDASAHAGPPRPDAGGGEQQTISPEDALPPNPRERGYLKRREVGSEDQPPARMVYYIQSSPDSEASAQVWRSDGPALRPTIRQAEAGNQSWIEDIQEDGSSVRYPVRLPSGVASGQPAVLPRPSVGTNSSRDLPDVRRSEMVPLGTSLVDILNENLHWIFLFLLASLVASRFWGGYGGWVPWWVVLTFENYEMHVHELSFISMYMNLVLSVFCPELSLNKEFSFQF